MGLYGDLLDARARLDRMTQAAGFLAQLVITYVPSGTLWQVIRDLDGLDSEQAQLLGELLALGVEG